MRKTLQDQQDLPGHYSKVVRRIDVSRGDGFPGNGLLFYFPAQDVRFTLRFAQCIYVVLNKNTSYPELLNKISNPFFAVIIHCKTTDIHSLFQRFKCGMEHNAILINIYKTYCSLIMLVFIHKGDF